jgi:soluble lytic murein transglycosylase-like protein
MHGKFTLLFVGAVLSAQPPADFEATVKAAMAPSIARPRAAVQKQVSAIVPAGAAPSASARSSFFTVPFPPAEGAAFDCDPLPAEQLDPLIEEAAQKTGVEAQLVRAVIDKESAGRPCALSAKGAEGLMQLMPATAEEFNVDDPFDPKQNVDAGAKLLKSLLERYKNDPALALGAYNAGPDRVDQAGGVPRIPETADYVTAILEKLGLKKATGSSADAPSNPISLEDF